MNFNMYGVLALFIILITTSGANDQFEEIKCGYASCPETPADQFNVHLIAHSHDDVGWLKTVDQYYQQDVTSILNSVARALGKNPIRKFIQVETAYLHMWLNEQSPEKIEEYKKLVKNGQIQIISGGWSMNDEATTNYQSVIDQFTLGLKFINDTFGECGKVDVGWQIDPFGHSKEMASLYKQMGFEALFFSRIDYREKKMRLATKTAEILWKSSTSLEGNTNLFTGILYDLYQPPKGFCFDKYCSSADRRAMTTRLESKIREFADFVRKEADGYATNNIIVTIGGDFVFQDAELQFSNLDKIIEGFKTYAHFYEGKRINVVYSTPSCYLKAVHEAAEASQMRFYVKTDDFFPYASSAPAVWTGYFTSRPTAKRFEREGNNILQITKQLSTFVPPTEEVSPALFSLQDAMGIMQHHDAITGTAKQHVANDYNVRLSIGIENCVREVADILSVLLDNDNNDYVNLDLKSCLLSNVSVCNLSKSSDDLVAIVYNPLSHPVSHHVRLPASSKTFTILDPTDKAIPYDVFPSIDDFDHLKELSPAKYDLVFLAEDIPPLGLKLFRLSKDGSQEKNSVLPDTSDAKFKAGNEMTGFELDSTTGLLNKIIVNGTPLNVKQEFLYYVGASTGRQSGAYIFRPNGPATSFRDKVVVNTYRGDLVDEVHQSIYSWVKQVIRVYKNTNHIEFDWLVGPIDTTDRKGKEVISRFTTDIDSGDVFYTDANGRQMMKRIRDFRYTYEYTGEEPVSSNYYPITSKVVLKDANSDLEFAVVNDRSQGGASLESGQVELMVHRRLLYDDRFGVGEALNEREFGQGLIARGKHFVTFGRSAEAEGKTTSRIQKDLGQRQVLGPWTFLTNGKNLEDSWKKINKEFSGLTKTLPDNVQILTLEPWRPSENKVLLRLEHVFEKDEDPILSEPVIVDLENIFTQFEIVSLQEMHLAANKELNEKGSIFHWKSEQELPFDILNEMYLETDDIEDTVKAQPPTDLKISLGPMQIRTFIALIKYK